MKLSSQIFLAQILTKFAVFFIVNQLDQVLDGIIGGIHIHCYYETNTIDLILQFLTRKITALTINGLADITKTTVIATEL